jgi:hypothetical protein
MVKRRISFRRVLCSFHRIIASRYFLAITAITIGLNSCYNEPETLGGNILPTSDILSIKRDTTFEVSGHTVRTDTIPTGSYEQAVLGCYNSDIFGKTKSDFMSQVSHIKLKDTLYQISPRPSADSLFLYIYTIKSWGTKTKPLTLRVYELAKDLADTISDNYVYYNGVDSTITKDRYIPTLINHPTTYNGEDTLKIRLTDAFANKLVSAPDSTFISNNKFVKYMKGLYITSDDFSESGGVLQFLSFRVDLVMHYHYYDISKSKDSVATIKYLSGAFSARFNHFKHDYSTATSPLKIKYLNNGLLTDTINQDSLFYISGLGGARGIVKFNGVKKWIKKMPIAINRAELRFDILEDPSIPKDSIISPLVYYFARDYDFTASKAYSILSNDIKAIIDYQVTQVITTNYSKAKKYYSIDVTLQLQNLLRGKIKRDFIYLEPSDFKYNYKEGVFRSGSNKTRRMKLIVTYTKL